MNLNNFRQYIDDIIFYRGYSYFIHGNVHDVEEMNKNMFIARVMGSKDYIVTVKMNDRADIKEIDCNCPYEGDYCKHEVAVLLELEDNHWDTEPVQENDEVTEYDLSEMLQSRTKQELIDIIGSIVSNVEHVGKFVKMSCSDFNDEQELTTAKELIQYSIAQNSDKHGFVRYSDAYNATEGARLVIERAKVAVTAKKYLVAVKLLIMVINDMSELLLNSDDDGIISMEIDSATGVLRYIIGNVAQFDKQERSEIFDIMFSNATDAGDTDMYLSTDYLEFCVNMFDSAEEQNRIWEHLDSCNADIPKLYELKYSMIEKRLGKEHATAFLQDNPEVRGFSERLYDIAYRDRDYDKCIQVAMEGEKKPVRPMTAEKWKTRIIDAFEMSGQIDLLKEYLLSRVMDGDMKVFYDELKYYHEPDTWQPVYLSILDHYEKQDKDMDSEYISILVAENEKKRLLNFIKLNPSYFSKYYEHLLPEYTEDVYMLFTVEIYERAEVANKKTEYYAIINLVNNLINAGGKKQAKDIVNTLKDKYRDKRMFMNVINDA